MLIIPYITIRKLSTNLGEHRNKFDIIAASIFYPFVFIAASYIAYLIDRHYEIGILNVYIGFAIAFIMALTFTWVARKSVANRIN